MTERTGTLNRKEDKRRQNAVPQQSINLAVIFFRTTLNTTLWKPLQKQLTVD